MEFPSKEAEMAARRRLLGGPAVRLAAADHLRDLRFRRTGKAFLMGTPSHIPFFSIEARTAFYRTAEIMRREREFVGSRVQVPLIHELDEKASKEERLAAAYGAAPGRTSSVDPSKVEERHVTAHHPAFSAPYGVANDG